MNVLRTLGLVGWQRIEPVVVAALAAELPLLFVSPHGTAKTEGAGALARALLEEDEVFTKYDTPIATIDDLVGYLSVKALQQDEIEYLRTKTCIWSASAVMFDEINRCSPLTLSKFMETIRTRSIHGVKTPVKYVFGGCNPVRGYKATYMDPAQASRWIIVQVPTVDSLSAKDIYDVIGGDFGGNAESKAAFKKLVRDVQVQAHAHDDMLRLLVARSLKALSAQALGAVANNETRPHNVQVRQGQYMFQLLRSYYACMDVLGDSASVSDIQAILMSCIPEVHGICDSLVDASSIANALRPVINETCTAVVIREIRSVRELVDERGTRDKTGWAAFALKLLPDASVAEGEQMAAVLVDMLRKNEIGAEAFNAIMDVVFKKHVQMASVDISIGFNRQGMSGAFGFMVQACGALPLVAP